MHGDLTTSNLLMRNADHAVVCSCPNCLLYCGRGFVDPISIPLPLQAMIDFGLSSNSVIAEDKAVDLYVLERAVTSTGGSDSDVVRLNAMPR